MSIRSLFICLIVFIISLFSSKVFAINYEEGYFYFTLKDYVVFDGASVEVEFIWDIVGFDMLNQKRFVVRPFTSLGYLEILNPETNKFVPFNDPNTNLPYLRDKMVIRFKGVSSIQSDFLLYFLVYDNLTGKIYKTQDQKIWSAYYYNKYLDLVNSAFNENLRTQDFTSWQAQNSDGTFAGDLVLEKKLNYVSKDPPKIYLWYFGPIFFAYGLIKSLNAFG